MLKGIGLLLIVSACSVTGASFSGRLKKRVTLLEKLLLFLELYMVELRCSMADTGELLRRDLASGQVRELWFLEEIVRENGEGDSCTAAVGVGLPGVFNKRSGGGLSGAYRP